jgi:predicted transcriptional regulator
MAKTYREKITERIIEREIVEDYIDVRLPSKAKFNNGDFITVFQKALEFISVELNLSKGAMKLLLYLIAKTEITNEIKLPIQSIAEILKISKGNAYDFLNELKRHNIVVWEQKLKTLRLNYELGYKGKIKDYKNKQYKDPQMLIEPSKNQLLIPLSESEERRLGTK